MKLEMLMIFYQRYNNINIRFFAICSSVNNFIFYIKCSLSTPANIPVVLSSPTTLYQTRSGGYQIEMSLPLGMVVNAVFKNQNWLYVQTPHAVEGYVAYNSCLPLGILPPNKYKLNLIAFIELFNYNFNPSTDLV